jgi:glutamine synthetase
LWQNAQDYKGTIDKLEGKLSHAALELEERVEELQSRIDRVPTADAHEAAQYCLDQLVPQMRAVREVCDSLEGQISSDWYPFPTYQQLLYSHHVEEPRS